MCVAQSCLTLYNLMDCSLQPSLSVEFSRQEYWSGLPFPPPGELPDPGVQASSPELAGGFFTTEPLGDPKNTGVGSLSLLQLIFPTQELNKTNQPINQSLYLIF